jgi:hypothetical protein
VAVVLVALGCLLPHEAARAQSASPELLQRVGAFVAGFVTGFSNVVAQEDLDLRRPKRAVRSDFLLVLFPGARTELMTFRDVVAVNGKELGQRGERLTDLFVKPADDSFRRAREIAMHAEEHVPSVLNPLLAISFLQADYQPRFRFTTKDARGRWPKGTAAVTFTETGSPTLLRTGPLHDLDVPSRGTAWVEEATGRVLETELQMRFNRDVATVATTFRHEERLDATVPDEMRTKNPDARATYGNFRRFAVSVDGAIALPSQ